MSSEQLQRLEADLAAVEARLAEPGHSDRTPQHRLDDERQWRNELLSLIELERERLARQVVPVAGGLPAREAGRWEPLPLFEKPTEEKERDLPILEVEEAERPDQDAIALEITSVLRSSGSKARRLRAIKRRWPKEAWLQRLLEAALRGLGSSSEVNRGRGPLLPPTPWLTKATEFPDEFDGLTATQRLVLQVVAAAAPPGRSFVRLTELAAEVAVREPRCDLPEVERTLISLGHPSLRRLPLVELQGLSGRFNPSATHFTHARLTRDGLAVLDQTFPLPLLLINGAEGGGACIPPHAPMEIAKACLFLLESPRASLSELTGRIIEGPDFPDGGVIFEDTVSRLWETGESKLFARAKIDREVDQQGNTRIVISELPWPLNGAAVRTALLERRLDGVKSVVDHSSATSGRVIVELEHFAFSGVVTNAIFSSRICELSFQAEFAVDGRPAPLDLIDLLRAFIEHRKELAVKKLDRAVAQARLRAQGAEAICLALALLEPVLAVMRAADEDEQAITGLMNFMRPEYGAAIASLPFPASHDYAKGFTEHQARHLMTVRKLGSRRADSAQQDWASMLSAEGEATALLSERQAILEVVRKELREALVRFDEPRRTELTSW